MIPVKDSNGKLSVKVELSHAANVFLLDSTNFRKWKNRQSFNFYGGHYTHSPVNISVNGVGRWYLIVENCRYYKYAWY